MRKSTISISLAVGLLAGMAQAATVTGKVNFTGTPPAPKPIKMAADPVCAKLHTQPVTTESVVVNKNNTLKWVFVWVKEGLEGKTFPTPTTPVTFDQSGCQYHPHVFGIMVNQTLEILNSDPTLHNIHAMPTTNSQFNLGMPVKGMKMPRKFDKPEIGAKIKCDVHPWMSGWANVVTHPFYAVTNDEGTFELKGLPAGKYTVSAWHEKFGIKDQVVTVTEDKAATAEFTFAATDKGASASAH